MSNFICRSCSEKIGHEHETLTVGCLGNRKCDICGKTVDCVKDGYDVLRDKDFEELKSKINNEKKDFRLPWLKPISKEEWKKFLEHSFECETRPLAYKAIEEMTEAGKRLTFLEIGFGGCYDFVKCFKELNDAGRIDYRGFDITEQFQKYAKEEYSEYNFMVGGFHDIWLRYDICFTANTLEHQPPEDYERCLRDMLSASKKYCIIIWFQAPRENGYMFWSEHDGFGGEGAWVNRYDTHYVKNIIESAGFSLKVHDIDENRKVYICERKNNVPG